jgi:type IV pilus assembly protein PilE
MQQMIRGKLQQKGFTLIEAITVVAIIGILSAVALPFFNNESMKNRRTEAISAATRIANELQEYHADNFTYQNYAISAAISNGLKWYTAAVVNPTQTTFTVTLTPIAGSAQAGDECGTFSIDEKGSKSVSSSTVAHCWSTSN